MQCYRHQITSSDPSLWASYKVSSKYPQLLFRKYSFCMYKETLDEKPINDYDKSDLWQGSRNWVSGVQGREIPYIFKIWEYTVDMSYSNTLKMVVSN